MKSEKVWKAFLLTFSSLLIAFPAKATELVEFRDYDATTGTFTNAVADCQLVTGGTTELIDGGWYAVQGTVACGVLEVKGAAHLVLCDGCELTVNGGIGVGPDKALTIYGQGADTGRMTANGAEYCAGIGGRDPDFHLGSYGSCGSVTINGGTVTATGDDGAGIGVGSRGAGGAITINGGTVTANGGYGHSGIGGGDEAGSSGTLTVRGGVVVAQGGRFGAGIGGGCDRDGSVVMISGGEVTARGGKYGAGVGGGDRAAGGALTMTGGALTAVPGESASDIGAGRNNSSASQGMVTLLGGAFWKRPNAEWVAPGQVVSANPDPQTRSACPYRVTAPLVRVTVPHDNFKVRWTGDPPSVTNDLTSGSFTVPQNTTVELFFEVVEGATYQSGDLHRIVQVGTHDLTVNDPPVASVPPIEYVDEHGVLRTNKNYRLLGAFDRTLLDGWYAVTRSVDLGEIAVGGDVHLILCDGQELRTNNGGVGVDTGKSLTIYGQSVGSGKLTALGSRNGAGIGGRNPNYWTGYGNCGSVTINGGIVSATGGLFAAGIGGGRSGSGGAVTINGGTVKATGGYDSVGIGSGYGGNGGSVTINGGSVVASSLSATPRNAAGAPLHQVKIPFAEGTDFTQSVVLGGLGDYGTFGIYPIDNKISLYLPDGEYHIMVTLQGSRGMVVAVVNGRDVVVEYAELGFTINGVDIAESQGDGWVFTEQDVLKLTAEREYVLAGYFTNALMSVSVEASATVVLSNATVFADGVPALSVSDGKTLDLRMSGFTSYLGATNNAAAIQLGDGAKLKVGTAAGADLLSTIAVFNYDNAPAIAVANGSVEVAGGSFLVWAAKTAVEGEIRIADEPESALIMKTGAEPETARFAESYAGEACLGIASSFTVTVPACEGIASVVVSNDVEALPGASGTFRGMLTDVVTVDFAAAEGCEVLSGGHVLIPSLTNDIVVGSAECPWPELRKWPFTVTIPEVPNVGHRLETSDAHMLRTSDQEYQIASNSEVTVTFQADRNYRFTASGDKSWTLTGDVTFGATDDFPLPTVEGILGTDANPWMVGESVVAYTNEIEQLTITGTGAMRDFAGAADVPWDPMTVKTVTVESGVTKIGANAWTAFGDGVLINNESIWNRKLIADGFAPASPEIPSGYITPADPNAIQIVNSKVYLGVSVATNADLTAATEAWRQADIEDVRKEDDGTVTLTVPAPAEKGFMILKSKPANGK